MTIINNFFKIIFFLLTNYKLTEKIDRNFRLPKKNAKWSNLVEDKGGTLTVSFSLSGTFWDIEDFSRTF